MIRIDVVFGQSAPESSQSAPGQLEPGVVGWRASPPSGSNLGRFRQCQRVFDFDAQVADTCLDLGMPEKDLHGAQVACLLVDRGCLCAPERVGAVILPP